MFMLCFIGICSWTFDTTF